MQNSFQRKIFYSLGFSINPHLLLIVIIFFSNKESEQQSNNIQQFNKQLMGNYVSKSREKSNTISSKMNEQLETHRLDRFYFYQSIQHPGKYQKQLQPQKRNFFRRFSRHKPLRSRNFVHGRLKLTNKFMNRLFLLLDGILVEKNLKKYFHTCQTN